MYAILYMSEGVRHFEPEEMSLLSNSWSISNALVGITGLLLYDGRRFMQLIEGKASETKSLMRYIERDHRHTNIAKMLDEPIEERQFAGWALRQQSWDGEVTGGSLREQAKEFIRTAKDSRVQAALMGFTVDR